MDVKKNLKGTHAGFHIRFRGSEADLTCSSISLFGEFERIIKVDERCQ